MLSALWLNIEWLELVWFNFLSYFYRKFFFFIFYNKFSWNRRSCLPSIVVRFVLASKETFFKIFDLCWRCRCVRIGWVYVVRNEAALSRATRVPTLFFIGTIRVLSYIAVGACYGEYIYHNLSDFLEWLLSTLWKKLVQSYKYQAASDGILKLWLDSARSTSSINYIASLQISSLACWDENTDEK